jgi:hypothetical protein
MCMPGVRLLLVIMSICKTQVYGRCCACARVIR